MSTKPIFVATHPRACSTAFERVSDALPFAQLGTIPTDVLPQVFMTQRDKLQCVHEPFGDAFYFGPERLGPRYEDDEKARVESGFGDSTYKSIFDDIMKEDSEVCLIPCRARGSAMFKP